MITDKDREDLKLLAEAFQIGHVMLAETTDTDGNRVVCLCVFDREPPDAEGMTNTRVWPMARMMSDDDMLMLNPPQGSELKHNAPKH